MTWVLVSHRMGDFGRLPKKNAEIGGTATSSAKAPTTSLQAACVSFVGSINPVGHVVDPAESLSCRDSADQMGVTSFEA